MKNDVTNKKLTKVTGQRKKKQQTKWAHKLLEKIIIADMAEIRYISVSPFYDNKGTFRYLIEIDCDWKDILVCVKSLFYYYFCKIEASSLESIRGSHDITVSTIPKTFVIKCGSLQIWVPSSGSWNSKK